MGRITSEKNAWSSSVRENDTNASRDAEVPFTDRVWVTSVFFSTCAYTNSRIRTSFGNEASTAVTRGEISKNSFFSRTASVPLKVRAVRESESFS